MGIPNVSQMLENMTYEDLYGWLSYFELEPFGFEIDNIRFGQISACIYNANRSNKNDKVWTPKDFFQFEKTNNKQSWQEQFSIANRYCLVLEGKE